MAFNLPLPPLLDQQRWKVKIQDKEKVEEPHVAIINKTRKWRFGLRSLDFLDDEPPSREVPRELVAYILKKRKTLIKKWNKQYRHNPV